MPRPRLKRLLRISLRLMLVVLTVLCVLLGWKVRQAERQKEVVAWVQRQGIDCSVWYDFEVDNDCVLKSSADPPGPKWLRDHLGIDYLSSVEGVSLMSIKEGDISPLAELTHLRVVRILNAPTLDFEPLSRLQHLEEVSLNCVNGVDLSFLTNKKSLKEVYLMGSPVHDLTPLYGLPSLRKIQLDGTNLPEDEIAAFRSAMPGCHVECEFRLLSHD